MPDVDINAPEVQTAITEAVKAQTTEALAGLESKNKQLLGETKAAKEAARVNEEKLKAFEGIDLEEINALKQAQEEQAQKKAEEEGKYSELLAANAEKHKAEVEALKESAETYKGRLKNKSMESEILVALEKEKGNATLLMPAIKARVESTDTDKGFNFSGLDQNGKPMLDENGQPATIADVVAHLKTLEEYQPAFEATRISGSGSLTNKGGKVVSNPWKNRVLVTVGDHE